MSKKEFIEKLRKKLSKLPQKEVEDRISFYNEMIDDKIDDGFTEQEAVAEIGDIDQIVSQIVAEIPLAKIVKENVKPKRRLLAWEIVLLILGAPIWLTVLGTIIGAVVSVYASIWSVVISIWAAEITLWALAGYGIVVGVMQLFIAGSLYSDLVLIGAGIASVGIAIFLSYACKYAAKGVIILTKKLILAIKNSFVKKEEE